MDNFADELELLLNENTSDDTHFSSELDAEEDQCSSLVNPTFSVHIEPLSPAPTLEPIHGNGDAVMKQALVSSSSSLDSKLAMIHQANVLPSSSSLDSRLAMLYQPNVPPTSFQHLLDEFHLAFMVAPFGSDASAYINQVGFGFPTSNIAADMSAENTQTAPPMKFIELHAQGPNIDHHQPHLHAEPYHGPTYLNPTGDPLDPNWEAIESYLAGHVRRGLDVSRVYKCNICNSEFPCAQAFGGHMSSHSKNKRGEKPLAKRKRRMSKKVRLNKRLSSASMKEKACLFSKEPNSIDEATNMAMNGASEEPNYVEFFDD
ncbi:hypothetical protein B296_00010082 [Ensete ventricosum]|uniref:C2H2-type domain-containing protein n=1 Tax=Ensete ventricosum TaxID=4639 RepID=A0A427AME9_ENSVE|nr:hypothetical protein B296_00010082 [Ensete ventricosum]